MRIKFWSDPIQVKFARLGEAFAGFFVTSFGIQALLFHQAPISHMHIGLVSAVAALLVGGSILRSAVTGRSDWAHSLRTKIEQEKLPVAETRTFAEEKQIKAIKDALNTSDETIAH